MLRKNQILRLSVTDLNNLGFGVARADGLVVFVAGAVDGDEVDAKVIRVTSGYAVARVERLVTPSPERVAPVCPAAGCGGCAYREVGEEHEHALKRHNVEEAFRKAGLPDVRVAPVVSTGQRFHYRNKAQYPVAPDGKGGMVIGFYAPKSHRVVPAEDCPLEARVFRPVLAALHELADRYHIPPYDETTGTGLLRHIYLRTDRAESAVLVTLVINGETLPHIAEFTAALRAACPVVSGLLLNVNQENTNVICGEKYIPVWGETVLHDELAGVRLTVSPASFYQVNHNATELLYARARELAALTGKETVLDLFCGIGSIGLSMARDAREVIGVEIVPDAVRCASENAKANGIENASFYCGDATDTEGLLAAAERERGEKIRPDVVLLDPPRKGCAPELIAYVSALAPTRVVYISCNPETLARDVALFARAGYTPGEVTPVNLFPCTGHVETVVLLSRA